MKTNSQRLSIKEKQDLKSRHRLEILMHESGERFEVDPTNARLLRSLTSSGCVVDLDRQTFSSPEKSGDIFTWLMHRNNWTFPQVLRFLQKRSPDQQQVEPALSERREEKTSPAASRGHRIKCDTPDPSLESSGLYERGIEYRDGKTAYIYELKPSDHWQEKALQIAGDRIRKYFTWQWYSLAMMDETRIEPVFAPSVTECARCEKHIDWSVEKVRIEVRDQGNIGWQYKHVGAIPFIAYSVKHPLKPWDFGIENDETSEAISGLWLEEEVICVDCAWREYDLLQALELIKKSAYRRMVRETEEKQERAQVAMAGRGE